MSKQKSKDITPVKQFALFIRKAKALKKLSAFEFLSTYQSSITMSWKQGGPLLITNLVKPEKESYRSYLIDFRQFLLSESHLQINKILKMAVNHARHISLREEMIKLQQEEFKEVNRYLRGIHRETENGAVVPPTVSGYDFFLMWFNGTIFHSDPEAEKLFDSLGILKDETDVNFAKFVGLCSNFIIHLAAVIESGLKINGFDLFNKFTPHTHAGYVLEITSVEGKAAVIEFWTGTKRFAQTLSVCPEHDQDTVIAVSNFDETAPDLQKAKVELKSCCEEAANQAIKTIEYCLTWIDHAQKHGVPQPPEPVEILEIEITDPEDIQIIKTMLEDYRLLWRRKIGAMRCPVHRMPPGARAFREDIYLQGDGKENDSVFLQGCCLPFIRDFLKTLKADKPS